MFRRQSLAVLGMGMFFSVAALQPANSATLISTMSFESGVLTADSGSVFTFSGNAPTITQEHVRAGSYAMKTYLNRLTSATSYRTEVAARYPVTHVGDELWYGFSIYLPASYTVSPIWEIVAQWHDTPDDWNLGRQNPPLLLQTSRGGVGGRWYVTTLWDAQPVAADGTFKVDGMKTWDLGAYAKEQWTDWVFHIKWSYGSDGILQVWQNGVLVIDYRGPNTYNDKIGPYFKMGMYKGWKDRHSPLDTVGERVLYHDEFKVAGAGASYKDVAPSGGTTLKPNSPTGLRAE